MSGLQSQVSRRSYLERAGAKKPSSAGKNCLSFSLHMPSSLLPGLIAQHQQGAQCQGQPAEMPSRAQEA